MELVAAEKPAVAFPEYLWPRHACRRWQRVAGGQAQALSSEERAAAAGARGAKAGPQHPTEAAAAPERQFREEQRP